MITISGTTVIDQTPKGGASVDLMTSLLRAREAADACYLLAEQAKDGRHAFLAEFWSEIAGLQMEVLRRTAAAVERLGDEPHPGGPDESESVTGEQKTGHQRETDPNGGAQTKP
jgi:hypothetical protein